MKKFESVEEVKKRAEELSATLNTKVHPMSFRGEDDSDLVVGFVKEPPFLVKARAMDKMYAGMSFTAGIDIFDNYLIKEDSDPRLTSAIAVHDKYRLGAIKFCGELVKLSIDQTEKKN